MRRFSTALVALGLVVTACGNDAGGETTTTAEETTTTQETTTTVAETTTTVDDGPRSLLNGLPVDDPTLLDRRALAIKVDNHPDSRPQAGVQDAELVFEILVEGVTRWLTVFHTTDSEFLGGNRSGRPSDARLIRPLEAPFLISGAQAWVQAGIRDEGVDFFIEPGSPVTFRVPIKRAPHNLFVNTQEFRNYLDEREVPDDPPPTGFWEFGELPEGGTPVEAVDVSFLGSSLGHVTWEWDGTQFERTTPSTGLIDEEGEETPITADVLITIVGHQYIASPPSGSGTSVPSTETTGEGRVIVMADGRAVEGTWTREESTDPFTFTTEDGEPLLVPPGRPWVNILPDSDSAGIEW